MDVLSRFLSQTQAHASRVALLVLRNDRLTGWKAVGYDATGGRDESVRAVDLSSEDDPFVAAVLKGQRSMVAEPPDENAPLRRALSAPLPRGRSSFRWSSATAWPASSAPTSCPARKAA